MFVMVYGGAACGKSEFAEALCAKLGGRKLYIATMRPQGEDALRRIERHQQLRAGRGFDTMEYYDDLRTMMLPPEKRYDTVLLECGGNIVANGLFAHNLTAERVVRGVLEGTRRLEEQVEALVMVTNDIFADGVEYGDGIRQYLDCMAKINRLLAKRADVLIEIVCGLPLYHKGRGELAE